MIKVICVGYFGYGNGGDQELLKKGRDLLLDVSGAEVSVASKQSPLSTVLNFLKASHVVFLGGNLFQDKTSLGSVLYYASFAWACVLLKKPYFLVAQGIGPLQTRLGIQITRWVFRHAALCSVRDGYSQKIAESWGCKEVHLHCDLSYYKEPLQTQTFSEASVFGVSLMPCRPEVFQKIKDALPFLPETSRFVSAYHPLDWTFWKHYWVNSDESPISLEGLFNGYDCDVKGIISMRYHTCIWASQQGIPFLVMSEDPKCLQLAKELHQPAINLTKIHNANQIKHFLQQFLDHSNDYRRELLAQRDGVAGRIEQLKELLKKELS